MQPQSMTTGTSVATPPLIHFVLLTKAITVELYEPKTYDEAIVDAYYKMKWQLAMEEEVQVLTIRSEADMSFVANKYTK